MRNLDFTSLPRLSFAQKDDLPVVSAIYFVIDVEDNLLYIGKTMNLRNRWKSHHRLEQFKQLKNLYILWMVVDSENLSSFESQLIEELNPQLNKQSLADYRIGQITRNTQVGIRLPNDLYAILENERSEALERGEKVTMTELIVKYLYKGMDQAPMEGASEIKPTLERLTNVLERIEAKL